jgi:hypothetical protein
VKIRKLKKLRAKYWKPNFIGIVKKALKKYAAAVIENINKHNELLRMLKVTKKGKL